MKAIDPNGRTVRNRQHYHCAASYQRTCDAFFPRSDTDQGVRCSAVAPVSSGVFSFRNFVHLPCHRKYYSCEPIQYKIFYTDVKRTYKKLIVNNLRFNTLVKERMKSKPAPSQRDKSPFVNDAIMRETVRKQMMYEKDFGEFQPSITSLREATPDKPLIDSFVSKLWLHPEVEDEKDDEEMKATLNVTRRAMMPHDLYKEPLTTSMELGWDQYDVPRFKSMFDFHHKKTDITSQPSRWDPHANVMTVKDKPR